MKITGTRTFLELRVGTNHVVEVILYLRNADIEWFNSNAEEHETELFGLLTNSIIPRMCGDEIERFYATKYPRDYPTEIGEKNFNKQKNQRKGGRKRKRAGGKKQQAHDQVVGQALEEMKEEETKKVKDIYYAFGETLHVAYRTEDLNKFQSATLLFTSNSDSKNKRDEDKDGGDGNTSSFKSLHKLSKRIIMWCYPLNPDDPTAPDPEGGGFRRPELIPISQLFRDQPEEDKEKKQETKPAKRKKR